MDHLARTIALEEAPLANGAKAVSLAPGVIDTEMQAQLRSADPAAFPERARFVGLKTEGQLDSAATAAAKVLKILDRRLRKQRRHRRARSLTGRHVDHLITEIHRAGYAVLTLNRPQAMNALSRGLMRALADAVDALERPRGRRSGDRSAARSRARAEPPRRLSRRAAAQPSQAARSAFNCVRSASRVYIMWPAS
jgi:hypothetical protein